MFGLFRRKGNTPQPPSLEWQLAELEKCGIRLAPDRTIDELLNSFDRATYENEPFDALLFIMGGIVEFNNGKKDTRLSHDLFHIDTECIVEAGDYVNVVVPFAALAGGDLPITNVRDFVDLDAETAWIEFELDDKLHHLDAEVDNDWCDPKVIEYFVALAKERRNDDSIYIHIDNGQAFTTGYLSEPHFKRLCKLCPSLSIKQLG